MSKFTKGKWHVVFQPYIAGIFDEENNPIQLNEANAMLIAAAPEMYNLLKAIANIDILKNYVETTECNGKVQTGKSVVQDINELLERIDGNCNDN